MSNEPSQLNISTGRNVINKRYKIIVFATHSVYIIASQLLLYMALFGFIQCNICPMIEKLYAKPWNCTISSLLILPFLWISDTTKSKSLIKIIATTIAFGILFPPLEEACRWLSVPLYNMGFMNDLAPKLLISPTSVDEVIWDTVRTIPIFLVELAVLRALGYAINRRLFPCLERLARASAIRIHGRLCRIWRDRS